MQAKGGRAAQAFGEATNWEWLASQGEEYAIEQIAEANKVAEGRSLDDGFGGFIADTLVESSPEIAAILASAGAGAAVGSLAGPVGAGAGALTGLIASAFGVNLGTAKEIELSLDPESRSTWGTMAAAGVATTFDTATGGFVAAPFKAVGKAGIKEGVREGAEKIVKKKIAQEVAKTTAGGAVSGAGSSLALDVGATLSTDSGFDENRVDAIVRNAATEFMFSGVLSGTAGAVGAGVQTIRNKRDDAHPIQFDDSGDETVTHINPLWKEDAS